MGRLVLTRMVNFVNMMIASGGGIGYFPLFPGTVASAVIAGLFLALPPFGTAIKIFLSGIFFVIGVVASRQVVRITATIDPSWVVIDEVVGMCVALSFIPQYWCAYAITFVVFRIFDIYKPFPISLFEKLPHGWGIMCDDLAAGLAAGLVGYLFVMFSA